MSEPLPSLKNFKFQIWVDQGKMTDPPTLTENFRFGMVMER